jgi:hypothetical protein
MWLGYRLRSPVQIQVIGSMQVNCFDQDQRTLYTTFPAEAGTQFPTLMGWNDESSTLLLTQAWSWTREPGVRSKCYHSVTCSTRAEQQRNVKGLWLVSSTALYLTDLDRRSWIRKFVGIKTPEILSPIDAEESDPDAEYPTRGCVVIQPTLLLIGLCAWNFV